MRRLRMTGAARPSLLLTAVLLAFLLLAGCAGREEAASPSRPLAPVEQGGASFYATNCQACHGESMGGSMMDIPPRHNANGHTWHHADCQLVEFVLDGTGDLAPMSAMMRQMMGPPDGGVQMPAFRGKLTEEEVNTVLAYVKTWWTEEQRRYQAEQTRLCRVDEP